MRCRFKSLSALKEYNELVLQLINALMKARPVYVQDDYNTIVLYVQTLIQNTDKNNILISHLLKRPPSSGSGPMPLSGRRVMDKGMRVFLCEVERIVNLGTCSGTPDFHEEFHVSIDASY